MNIETISTNQKGKITESEVLKTAISLGIEVSIPFGDKSRYDQIWDTNGRLYRIQIKTCHSRRKGGDAIEFNCYSSSNGKRLRYSTQDIDYFATSWEGQVYLIPVNECSIEKVLWFTPTNSQCQSLAKDYEIEEVLKRL